MRSIKSTASFSCSELLTSTFGLEDEGLVEKEQYRCAATGKVAT